MRSGEIAHDGLGRDTVPADVPYDGPEQYEELEGEQETPSLLDDLGDLIDDTKSYLEAEAAFQKSRAGYIGNRLKYAVAYGAVAFGIFHLALIAITVGVVIALVPIIGAWLATLLVGGVLIVGGLLLLRALKSKVNDIRSAFDKAEP